MTRVEHCGPDYSFKNWPLVVLPVLGVITGWMIGGLLIKNGYVITPLVSKSPAIINSVNTNTIYSVGVAQVNGHNYLVFPQGVVHDQSCPCMSK